MRHAGSTRLSVAHAPRPEEAKSFPLPSQHGLRFDDHQGILPPLPHPLHPHPERPIGWRQPQPFSAPTAVGPRVVVGAQGSLVGVQTRSCTKSAATSVSTVSTLARTDVRRLAKPNHLRTIRVVCRHNSQTVSAIRQAISGGASASDTSGRIGRTICRVEWARATATTTRGICVRSRPPK